MKRFLLFTAVFVFLAGAVWGQQSFIWTGASDTVWTNGSNWDGGISPNDGNGTCLITINLSGNDPVFSGAELTCGTLTILSGASLDMGQHDLTVDTLENEGILILEGDGTQVVSATNISKNDTVSYNGSGVNFAGLTSFTNLTVQDGVRTGVGEIIVNGDFRLESGSLEATTIDVTGESYIAGNITTVEAQKYTGNVTLGGTVTLTGTIVRLGNITGATHSLTVTGDGVLNGGSGIDVLSVSGTTTINEDITTTGTQTYTGAVTLGDTVTLTGTIVRLGNITGATHSLTITGNGVLSGGNGINFLSVSGTTTINTNITTTGTGGQTYTGAVTLGGTGTKMLQGAIVTLGAITGNGNSLTITGSGVLSGGSGINVLSVSGTTTINGDITTTGAQTYTGAVTLGDTATLTGTTVTLGNITGANHSLTIAGNGTLSGASGIVDLSVNGNLTLNTNALSSATVNVTGTSAISTNITTTGNQTYTGDITLSGVGTRTLTSNGGSVTAVGKITGTTNITVSASQEISLNGANAITTTVTLTGGGNIEFNNNRGSAGNLTVNANTNNGNITIMEITGNVIGSLKGKDITINAGGDISPNNIEGNIVTLNAGYPYHEDYGAPGKVELKDVNVGDLIIWCKDVSSIPGTKIAVNIDVNSDNKTVADSFLNDFFGTSESNELRSEIFEFGPTATHANCTLIAISPWPYSIDTGGKNIYITGDITDTYDLTITSGNIVFEGNYATMSELVLDSNGKIEQIGSSTIKTSNLEITAGGAVTLAKDNEVQNLKINSAGGNVVYKNNGDLNIDGIGAGANDLNITVEGNITLSGNIDAKSITIEADSITGSGVATASAGDISLVNNSTGNSNISLNSFNASNGNIFVSAGVKDIVYHSSAQPSGGTWGAALFVAANSTSNRDVQLQTKSASNNIYLVNVTDSSNKILTVNSSAGTGSNGFIEFFTTGANSYVYTGSNSNHLNLIPGAGGIRINKAVVDITGDFKINNTSTKLILDGSGASSIKAVNINLNGITATNTTDKITLTASRDITVSGKVTAYQLIAKAPAGTVKINEVDINSSNAGNEGESAAIYILADTFVVTTTTVNSIVPGGPGGHLCLNLNKNTPWVDVNNVIDGIEGMPSTPGARWHQHFLNIRGKILYSFTEDSSGNGILDRIRVQTNVALYGDFSGFDVSVEEYEVDRTKGAKGFQMVNVLTNAPYFDNDSFYIYLIENPEIDNGSAPLWSVTKNTSLTNAAGIIVGDPAADKNIKPIDTIPPRVAYALTIPGYPQTYVRMSEPVVSSSGADISALFGGLSVVDMNHVEPDTLGYIFNLSDSFSIDDLVDKNIDSVTLTKGYFQIDAVDKGQAAADLSVSDNESQPPKYPLNWRYTAYAKVYDNGDVRDADGAPALTVSDVFIPPNKLLTDTDKNNLVTPNSGSFKRRVTDVLISRIPSASGDESYFAWPVWARFKTPVNAGSYANDDMFFGQKNTDIGIIWQFDGTNYLETRFIDTNDGIELQARVNNKLTGSPVLFWTTADIPAEMRNPQETTEAKKVGGLWLPNVLTNTLYNYVPLSDGINSKPADSSSSKLFNYYISPDDLAIDSGAKFEFIFRLSNSSDMFAARLDIPGGAVIPANWYTLVRPFVFDIRNIRRQRGGVTIMNNVINSDKKEATFIRYHMTRPGRVTIQVYTLDGTLVKSLRRNEQRDAGEWTDGWDGTNNGGRAVARGMYFVRVVGPDIDEIRKIMVVK
ncbi:MAG: hypothetical protein LBV17_06440 [Treponema sp.]|jgi:hypothetical protein|nr:hypothetical protein [Treponema sp.]